MIKLTSYCSHNNKITNNIVIIIVIDTYKS